MSYELSCSYKLVGEIVDIRTSDRMIQQAVASFGGRHNGGGISMMTQRRDLHFTVPIVDRAGADRLRRAVKAVPLHWEYVVITKEKP